MNKSLSQHSSWLQTLRLESSGMHIAVIGDCMLDRFAYGHIERMSPEAPVPVVRMVSEEAMPGGAGNVAMNCIALSALVSLFSVVGNDEAGMLLTKKLSHAGIDVSGIIVSENRCTTEKRRIVGNGAHVVRVDYETHDACLPLESAQLLALIESKKPYNAIVVSDYAKGVITQPFANAIVNYAHKHNIPILVDTKPAHSTYFSKVSLLTPNEAEAQAIGGAYPLLELGNILYEKFQSPILITQGAEGMSVFSPELLQESAYAKQVTDVSGAGDTVVAAASIALAAELPFTKLLTFASLASAVAVSKSGTATVTWEELELSLHEYTK